MRWGKPSALAGASHASESQRVDTSEPKGNAGHLEFAGTSEPENNASHSKRLRPRNSKQKVKTGCSNCKRRRIKCDEKRPACAQCVRSKKECIGYPPPPGETATENDYEEAPTLSLTGQLCREIIKTMRYLLKSVIPNDRETAMGLHYQSLERSYDRLRIWSNTYDVSKGGIDELIQQSPLARTLIRDILLSVGELIVDAWVPLLSTSEKVLVDEALSILEDSLRGLMQDLNEDKSLSSSYTTETITEGAKTAEIVAESLRAYTTGLLELDPLLRESYLPAERVTHEPTTATLAPHQAFGAQIQQQYPSLPNDIAMRLGHANWKRFLRCLQMRETAAEGHDDEEEQEPQPAQLAKSNSQARDSGYGSANPATTYKVINEEAASQYAATVMTFVGEGTNTARLPRLSASAKTGVPFNCVACGALVTYQSDKEWKEHLLADLQPWVCVEPKCSMGSESFESNYEWIEHLIFDHELEPDWASFPCIFCGEQTGSSETTMVKHIGNHLERIASVLVCEEPDENDELIDDSRSEDIEASASENWHCSECNPPLELLGEDCWWEHQAIEHGIDRHSAFNQLTSPNIFEDDPAGLFKPMFDGTSATFPLPDMDKDPWASLGNPQPSLVNPQPSLVNPQPSLVNPQPSRQPYSWEDCTKVTSFKDEQSLRVHRRMQHARPFTCLYHFAGCLSTFATKNEWKRHITSQHIILHYWLCNEGLCSRFSNDHASRPSLPNGTIFNRKDLYTQHLRRMHVPAEFKKQLRQKNKHIPEWEKQVKATQKAAVRIRCNLPEYMECPVPSCDASFSGRDAWDQRMEHLSRHLEVDFEGSDQDEAQTPYEPADVKVWGSNDPTLVDWSARPDVGIIRRSLAGMGWELNNPLRTSAGPRKPHAGRGRVNESSQGIGGKDYVASGGKGLISAAMASDLSRS